MNEPMTKEQMKEYYEHAVLERDGCKKLTDRELDIIRLGAKGYTHKEIAEKLGIGARTVAVHNYRSFQKINARNIIEAINHVKKFYKAE